MPPAQTTLADGGAAAPDHAGLYRAKAASQRLVRPLGRLLARHRISPDLVTASGVLFAAAGGACLALSPDHRAALLAVPIFAAARLVANLLDGMVARDLGVSRPAGELWNELADRFGDVLFIGGLAFVPAVDARLALLAVVMPVLSSFTGVAAKAAGGERGYGGVLSKPGRMAVLAVAAPLAWLAGDSAWLAAGAAVIAAGSALTLAQRWLAAVRAFGREHDHADAA